MRDETEHDDHGLSESLIVWQRSGDHASFDALWAVASRLVADSVRKTFRRAASRDKSAMDEAAALVMDHVRRLPTGQVARFTETGSAKAYLHWLADRRAMDVLRLKRRRAKRMLLLAKAAAIRARDGAETDCPQAKAAALQAAIARLDERSRYVLESHLRGEPQAVAARALGIAEGTVTRIRQRAIAELRRLLLVDQRGKGGR
jgi:RNA polymerase sigma factor (sigma-70 family)